MLTVGNSFPVCLYFCPFVSIVNYQTSVSLWSCYLSGWNEISSAH